MPSFLSGSLAKTIGAALSSTFLPSTLSRGATSYPCRAIFAEYNTGQAAEAALTNNDCTVLVLATTLAVEPVSGDVITISGARYAQGQTFVVLSLKPGKPAVSGDPAGACWTLQGCKTPLTGPGGSIPDAYAALAEAEGVPHEVFRPCGTDDPITSPHLFNVIKALFTDGGGAGFNLNRGLKPEDVIQNVLTNTTELQVGDYLVRSDDWGAVERVYFILGIEPMRPVNAVLCNRRVSHMRGNSQLDADGGSGEGMPSQSDTDGTYFGVSRALAATGPGEMGLAQNIPVALVPLAGAARGQGEVPSDAPGPGRYRMYLPVSVFPLGSVKNGDIFMDDQTSRYQVATNGWTALGYRVEMIRLEN